MSQNDKSNPESKPVELVFNAVEPVVGHRVATTLMANDYGVSEVKVSAGVNRITVVSDLSTPEEVLRSKVMEIIDAAGSTPKKTEG